jgi:hypothetical protein
MSNPFAATHSQIGEEMREWDMSIPDFVKCWENRLPATRMD